MRNLAMITATFGFCLSQIANANVIDDLQKVAVRVIFYNLNCGHPSGLLMTTMRAIASDMSDEEYTRRSMEMIVEIENGGGNKVFCQLYAPIILKLEKQIPSR